ncbi:MAG: response regulator [Desulfatitalea sp.]|nr:response regulator [Desulfatitalea sp.]
MNRPEILLIDDEPIVGQRLKGSLEKLGCAVQVFQDPSKALDRIRETRFDIIVTDVMMPDVSGIQILEAAKAVSADTRVIIITGFATSALARECMDKGAFDMIAKPFKPSDLRTLVLRAAKELGFTELQETANA